MKNSNNIKQVVFIIGFLTLLVGLFNVISNSLMTNFLPLYIGLALIGLSVSHKEEKSKTLNA